MEFRDFLGIYGALLAVISRHCRGGRSAFWGHIILYVPVEDPVVGARLFVEMWETDGGTAPPAARGNQEMGQRCVKVTSLSTTGEVRRARLRRIRRCQSRLPIESGCRRLLRRRVATARRVPFTESAVALWSSWLRLTGGAQTFRLFEPVLMEPARFSTRKSRSRMGSSDR